ncbi:hypothetical protein N9094_01335 [bacterium]|nr:hypothetical protein [bacterium]MDB4507826.1 hypothetical protein [bacterium]
MEIASRQTNVAHFALVILDDYEWKGTRDWVTATIKRLQNAKVTPDTESRSALGLFSANDLQDSVKELATWQAQHDPDGLVQSSKVLLVSSKAPLRNTLALASDQLPSSLGQKTILQGFQDGKQSDDQTLLLGLFEAVHSWQLGSTQATPR